MSMYSVVLSMKARKGIFKNTSDDGTLMIEILKTKVDIVKVGLQIGNMSLKGYARRFEFGTIRSSLSGS